MPNEFAGKVVLVTGGGKGVGRAIAQEFASLGAHVVVNYFHSVQMARRTAAEIAEAGGSSDLIRASVAKADDVAAMFATVRERAGRLDVLVNNAARGVLASAESLTDAEWLKVFDVNVHGARRCARAALPLLAETGGSVVNVSSIGAGMVIDNYAVVGVGKAALEALSRYLAVEFAPHGVRVNVASAGLLDNPTADLFPGSAALRETCAASAPLGRLGTEEELARLVTALASPRLSWVTGQSVLADGGLTLGHAMLRPNTPAGAPSEPPATRPVTSVPGPRPALRADVPRARTAEGPTTPESEPGTAAHPPVRVTARADTPRTRHTPRPVSSAADPDDGSDVVAVVGMGLVLPDANGPEEFWELLRGGEPVFDEPGERFRQDAFLAHEPGAEDRAYTLRGGYVRRPRLHKEAKARSCAQDISAQWLRHSLAQAYENVTRRAGDRVECFVGTTVEGNQHTEESLLVELTAQRLLRHWPDPEADRDAVSERLRALLRRHYPFATGNGHDHLPDRVVDAAITELLPPGSPYTTVDTACSSSLYAVDLGTKVLMSGDCEIAVCAGVFTNTPRFSIMFSALRGLSPSGGVHAFDRAADGTLFSDGAGAVVLKTLRRAREDGDEVLALLGGLGTASDGRGKAVYAPNPSGQERAVRRARQVNDVAAEDVDWVVAHGTGTSVGDRVELGSLDALAPPAGYPCTSNKSLVGHTGWPAGVVSLIHAVLGLRHGLIPAQRPLTDLSEDLRGKRVRVPVADVPLPRRDDRSRTVGVSAFGFGGTDAHLLVQDVPPAGHRLPRSAPRPALDDVVLVAWSAHLPGDPSAEQVRARLAAGEPPAPLAAFPTPYPAPLARELRMAPRTVRTVDHTQLMALAVAMRFAEEHGALWEGVEERTGVLAAHTGPVGAAGPTALRCYADDLRDLRALREDEVSAAAFAEALRRCLDEARRERVATNEDTLPGIGPNIIPARLANRLDLHGPALTLDTGASSALTAVRTASQYLAAGEIDLALVVAVNGNSTPELAALLGERPDRLAEGAFLLALARRRDAEAKGWPVLCALTTDPRPDRRPVGGTPRARTYLAADGAVDLLAALAGRPERPVTVTGAFPGPAVALHPATASGDASPRASRVVPEPPRDAVTTRYVPRLEPLPPLPDAGSPIPANCLVLTDEASAQAVRAPAGAASATVVVVRPGDDPEALLAPVLGSSGRQYRHLRVYASWPVESGTAALPLSLHEALFLAAQRCAGGLERGSLGVLLAEPMPQGVPGAATGLFTGFVKSLSWELPECACRVLIGDEPVAVAWRALEAELGHGGGLPLTIRRSGTRYRQRLRPAPPRTGPLPLRPGDVVVATGGARGITAAAVEGLLDHLPLKVWLLGSSSVKNVPADLLAAAEEELPRLRARFIAEGRKSGEGASVAELNRRFQRLLRARESLLTLERLRRRGGQDSVHYLTCDVTDPAAVRAAVDTVLAQDGGVDLLVNGAGIHHPGDLARKILPEFRRVRDVKLDGYRNLKDAFAASPPRLWCNFGSVTGLVGLPGEVEYSSANDFLTAAARHERVVGGRDEYTIAWTVWDEVGLGGNAVTQSLLTRVQRLSSMSKAEGVAHFVAELAQPGPRESVVSFIGASERESFERQFPGYFATPPGAAPTGGFLGVADSHDERSATWRLVLDERRLDYLRGHLVDGKPTLPGTMLMGIAVEAAQGLLPGEPVHALRDLSFSQWVRATARPAEYRVTAVVNRGRSGVRPSVLVRITSDVTAPSGRVLRRDREHFRATVLTGPPRRVAIPVPGEDLDQPVGSPYYHPESPVLLSGGFRTTSEWRAGRSGASALWRPDPDSLPDVCAVLTLPTLLLDGLARTHALRPVAEGVQELEVPRYVRRVEWFTTGTDVALAGRYPAGVRLHWDAATGVFSAVAPDGNPLAVIEAVQSAFKGRVGITGAAAAT
ncbi:SDR family oxidoreductase [Amycolatopsis sp. NPDC051102]|uniref:SDR family oxidoreductase n=1 Tax=Amycolatopsis sp. NPDC051102 TaxID=3155163 RepID=UPI00343858CE